MYSKPMAGRISAMKPRILNVALKNFSITNESGEMSLSIDKNTIDMRQRPMKINQK